MTTPRSRADGRREYLDTTDLDLVDLVLVRRITCILDELRHTGQHVQPADLQSVQRHRPMSSHRLNNRPLLLVQLHIMTGYDLVQVGSVQNE